MTSPTLFLLCFFITLSFTDGIQLKIVNKCKDTIWPGILATTGHQTPNHGGFRLYSDEQASIDVPEKWSGRIWARQGCCFDQNSGKGYCESGDCGGFLQCNGTGGSPPTTLVEMTFGSCESALHYYDVSLVDGFNVPVAMTPEGGGGGGGGEGCDAVSCDKDLNVFCPSNLVVKKDGKVVACKSACTAARSDRYCCTGEFANPEICKPSVFGHLFKAMCPKAYSYAFDDSSALKTCRASRLRREMSSEANSKIGENSEGLGWGSSLPVPSVQELARNDPQCVPERYIQKLEDRPLHFETCQVSEEIPVINLTKLANGDGDERRNLDFACKEWGFFQVTDHGVSDKVLRTMKAVVAAFFELPLVEKKVYSMAPNDVQGYGQGYVVSDEQKLDWNDLIFLIASPLKYKNMKYWPNALTGFREAVELYSTEIQKVGDEIFANMSVLMGMEKETLKDIHGVMKLGIRMNYYPSCTRPDLVLGVSPHSDASSLTLLLQDDEITGLQIKHKGIWVPVKPIPNALVVNIGDVMEVLSNGVYRSVEHRAVTNQENPRISIATFVIPEDELEIEPLGSMVDEDHRPRMYKKVKYIDYLRYTLGRRMEGKSHIENLKLDNV